MGGGREERGECFGYGVPPPFPGGWGGESLKCFQKMRKWSLPLEWLVTSPPPGPSEHPPRVWYIQGGSRLPWRASKGVRALLSQQQWVRGLRPSTLLFCGEREEQVPLSSW